MNFDQKLNELNINLPKAADPVGSYVAAKISGKMLFISGQISIDENGNLVLLTTGGKRVIPAADIYF